MCQQAVKALSASAGRALPRWARSRVQRFLEKQRRGAPALLLLKLQRGLGVPLLPALLLCGPFCSMARLYPRSKALWMGLAESGGWELLASRRVQCPTKGELQPRSISARGIQQPLPHARCRMLSHPLGTWKTWSPALSEEPQHGCAPVGAAMMATG